jgi:hypothetical protein
VVAFVPRLKPCAYTYQLGIGDGEAGAQQKAFKERKDQRDI